MLVIRRKVGQRVVFGTGIVVTVTSTTPRAVRLAIDAPKGITVLRGEVHDAIVAANAAASVSPISGLTSDDPEQGHGE